jgi:outer membrane protein assembly factor BamB
MKSFAGVVAGLVILGTVAVSAKAQDDRKLYTRPTLPSPRVLSRLNLKLAWRLYVPTDGRRDGLFSVQILGDQVVVQTRSGTIAVYNAETGYQLWRTPVGRAYRVSQSIGYNSKQFFAYSGLDLVCLDRQTGHVLWEFSPPDAPSARPVADDDQLYLATGSGRLYAFELPRFGPGGGPRPMERKIEVMLQPQVESGLSSLYGNRSAGLSSVGPLTSARQASMGNREVGPQPYLLWDYRVTGRLEASPLLFQDLVLLADTDGTFFAMPRLSGAIKFSYQADAALSAPLEQHNEMAYVASMNFYVYALNIPRARIDWRFTTGRPILGKPIATDEDVYVVANGTGFSRLDRMTGQEMWRHATANHFLAANKNLVYAADSRGRLLVLDRALGTQLALHDIRDFNVLVANEVTDRLYLAANDGLLVCLYDPAFPTPYRQRKPEEKPAPPEEKAPTPAPDKKPPKPEDDK